MTSGPLGDTGPLGLRPELWQVLACPCPTHAPVRPGADAIVCTHCETTFPVRDGVPVMLLDEATAGPNGVGGS